MAEQKKECRETKRKHGVWYFTFVLYDNIIGWKHWLKHAGHHEDALCSFSRVIHTCQTRIQMELTVSENGILESCQSRLSDLAIFLCLINTLTILFRAPARSMN